MAFLSYIIFSCLFGTALLCQLQTETLEEYIKNKTATINPRYRLQYHVTPPVGWMNDPNGFVYYKDKYHLFYQFYPYDSKWGPMHWGHVSSSDLVNWDQMSTALTPENGVQCYSGSAIVRDDILILMYTGDTGNSSSPYQETQYLAYSDNGQEFHKYLANPVLYPTNKTQDFRDPKVWQYENNWYVVIGSKTDEGYGRVLLYTSPNLVDWEYKNTIGASSAAMGYMWECPDFFELDGKFILLMSPQGMAAQGDRYKNLYQTGFLIGTFNYTNTTFKQEVDFQELDYGHDFYATQTTLVNGTRILMAWFGMWETSFPEAADGWAGAMTIPRQLSLQNNRVLMKPIDGITSLRDGEVLNGALAQNAVVPSLESTGELIISNLDFTLDFQLNFTGNNGGGNISLSWNKDNSNIVLNRAEDIRQVVWQHAGTTTSIRIFLDTSSIEVFCGDGEVVFSSRIYPNGNWTVTNVGTQSLTVTAYKLKKSVPV